MRLILERLENATTGEIKAPELFVHVPLTRANEVKQTALVLGNSVYEEFAFTQGTAPVSTNVEELILNRTWRPYLSVTGVQGIPDISNAGNVLREFTAVMLSLRIPPTLNPKDATDFLKEFLEKAPPHCARVEFIPKKASRGWDSPVMSPWLAKAVEDSSQYFFKKPSLGLGEGGTIPFMGMLGEKFPQAQFVVTGVLGPQSNAHGPNEFLHIQMGKNITSCVVHILAQHLVNSDK